MSEPVPCPTCGVLLRLPPGQAMVRCPGCKTVLAVEPADAPLVPPPPPAPVAPVAPLPFGAPRRAPVKPIAAVPAKPIPAPKSKQGPKNPFDAPTEEDVAAKEVLRNKQIRKELAQIDADERKEERKYDQLLVDCGHGRNALQYLAYGALSSSLGCLFYFLFLTGAAILVPVIPLLGLGVLGLVVHWVLSLVGFGYGFVGPRETRGLCIAGAIVTVLSACMTVIVALVILATFAVGEIGYNSGSSGASRSFAIEAMLLSNAISNLSCLTDIPVYLLTEGVRDWYLYLLPVIAAALEFTKMSLLSLLTHRLCMLGKEHDLAHQGIRFAYRMFGVVVVILILKIGLWVALKLVGGDPLAQLWFAIPLIMITNGYFMWSAYSWYALYQTQMDAMDVVVADRFADKRDRLDVV